MGRLPHETNISSLLSQIIPKWHATHLLSLRTCAPPRAAHSGSVKPKLCSLATHAQLQSGPRLGAGGSHALVWGSRPGAHTGECPCQLMACSQDAKIVVQAVRHAQVLSSLQRFIHLSTLELMSWPTSCCSSHCRQRFARRIRIRTVAPRQRRRSPNGYQAPSST